MAAGQGVTIAIMSIASKKAGKNHITWLSEGPGAHGEEPRTPAEVEAAISGTFRFLSRLRTHLDFARLS